MQTIKVNEYDIPVHKEAVFHALGPESDFDLEEGFFDEEVYLMYYESLAKKEGKTVYAYLVDEFGKEDVEDFFGDEQDVEGKYLVLFLQEMKVLSEVYDDIVKYKFATDDTILPGDLVYIFPTWYPSRNYYGVNLVSIDKEGKKVLNSYGDGIHRDEMTKTLVSNLLELNPTFFDSADESMYMYLGYPDAVGTTQKEVTSLIKKGGRRNRKTQKKRSNRRTTRKNRNGM
jgi:hypothetical protein